MLLSGEPGIGKSRLLRHFEASIAGTRSVCALARCVEFVQTPLSPLRELLAQLEVRGSLEEGAAGAELIERLAFERTADPTNSSIPVGSLFDSIDKVFARSALRRTTVLLIEDLHWADRSTIAFLAYLADRIQRRRILVVATYRAEELDSSHPRLADIALLLGKSSVEPLELDSLDERSSRVLVELTLPRKGAVDAATTADIVRRAQGNPFFIEELVKAALTSARLDEKKLPLSIRGAVLARAALLSDKDRHILSMAAVLGERFSIERLVALLDLDRNDVLTAIERACALQLVFDSPSAPGEIRFRHGLTQEVLYGELLAERVWPLHETIALEIERRADPSAFSVELAHHWRRAGNRARAAKYAELAGDHAFAIGAMADAILYYERAVADGATPASMAGLAHKTGLALGALDQLGAGIECLRRAGERYWSLGDLEGFAANASALGAQLHNSGDPSAASNVYGQAIEALEGKLASAKLDLLRARIAFNCVAALDFDSAAAFLSQIKEPINDPLAATHVYQTSFKVAAMRGDVERWRFDAERALDVARRLEDGGSRLRHTHCQIALDAIGLGETTLAREHLSAAMPADRKHLEPEVTLAAAASAFEHTLRGDFRTGARLVDECKRAREHNFAKLVHVNSAQLALGICMGDLTNLRRDDAEPLLHYGVTHGMNLALGLLGGPYAWALGVRGEVDDAAVWIARVARVLPGPHRFLFAYLAAAQFGAGEDVRSMHAQLAAAAARPHDRVNKAALALFEAFAGRREFIAAEVPKRALEAGRGFEAIGWPWFAALGYELGGESRRATNIYRQLGAVRDLRRIETGRPDATAAILSPREREVADLAASGHSNDEIAKMLHISLRTVEKHLSSALRKLNLRSRVQLGLLLARP